MAGVNTNDFVLKFAVEDSTTPGTLPADTVWKTVEPDDITSYGPTLTTIERNPIAQDRMAKKGAITDLDSSVEFNGDITMDSFMDFSQGYFMAIWNGKIRRGVQEGTLTAATTTGYTVSALDAALTTRSLVYAAGFTTAANNGLKEVTGTGNTTTTIAIDGGLTAEASPPSTARVELAGFRGASADLEIDAEGNMTSTAIDFTTLELTVGQWIYVGGDATLNQFATAAYTGFARIRAIEANKLTLEEYSAAWAAAIGAADAGTGKEIDVYFGGFLRNVSLSDTTNSIEETYMFEAAFSGLDTIDDGYMYAEGNRANNLTMTMGLTDKVTGSFSFIGLDTPIPEETAREGSSTNINTIPLQTDALNTTNDFAKISLKNSSGTEMGAYFTSLDLSVNNNAGAEKVLGTLGAAFTNFGDLAITGNAEIVFTSLDVLTAVRDNETCGFHVAMHNDDGAILFDVPSCTIGTGTLNFSRNEKIKISSSLVGFKDEFYGYVLASNYFPYISTTYQS